MVTPNLPLWKCPKISNTGGGDRTPLKDNSTPPSKKKYTPHPPPQEPNPEDPLNKEAAEVLQSNRRLFEQNVQRSLRGGYVGATYFERCLK